MRRNRNKNVPPKYRVPDKSRRNPSIPNPFNAAACRIVRRFQPGASAGSAAGTGFRSLGAASPGYTANNKASAARGPGRPRIPGNSEKLSRELLELGTGRKNCVEDFYVRKISNFLMIATVCLAVLSAVLVFEHRQDRRVADGVLERPGYGESGRDQSLVLSIGPREESQGAGQAGGQEGARESESFDIHLDARAYTSSQEKNLLNSALSHLQEQLSGENASLDEVRLPLSLPAVLENGAVTVEYYITPGGMIEEDGSISGEPDPDGSLVTITATLTCQDRISTYECAARIYPPILTAEQQFRENINHAVDRARNADPTDTKVKLPDTVDGRTLHWSYPKDSSLTLIMILMIILPIAYWAREDSKIHDAAKERLSQLELDYSQLLWKLTMLLSAGLTIRGAFSRITDQYEAEQAAKRYVYEEMLLTLREMRSGVPEASAYENFGRRCCLPAYIKLGSLLSQNLKKGSKGLTALLEHEAVLSMDQHKMAVRKIGERASVKMLLPMILMFGVVLIILMVPAFLSM